MAFAASVAEGDQFYQSGQAEAARLAWRAACAAATSADELLTISYRFLSLGFLSEAEAALAQLPANDMTPAVLAARSALALERGDAVVARQMLDEAAASRHLRLMSNALLMRHYENPTDLAGLLHASQQWAATAQAQKPVVVAATRGELRARLRIGFISGDLCAHPVGFLIAPIVQALAARPDEVEIFIFDNGGQNDWVTDRLKTLCRPDHWHMIRTLNDVEASHLILGAALDALVDCSGHTSRSRVALLANRLAPLQLSWGGYFSTTGLDTIDAVILDPLHAPDASEAHFVEKIVRFPSRFIYAPPPACPPVMDAPYFRNGVITFGSFNNIAKINDDVVALWASIMRDVPGSRLILKWRCFADPAFCVHMKGRFAQHGIAAERIDLRPFSVYRETLAEYRDVDIALDPFPFTGGQTSLDALWMGVPLVTMAGLTPVARQGHAFVNLIGKPEWSSSHEEAYVRCALDFARNPDALRSMRFDQRTLIHRSKLCDASIFADHLINLVRGV